MNLKTIAIASAVGSLLALGTATVSAKRRAKEKCLGVAEAGKNDCAQHGSFLCRPGQDRQGPERVEVRAERRVRKDGRQGAARKEGDVTDDDTPRLARCAAGTDSGACRDRSQVRASRSAARGAPGRRLHRGAHRELLSRGRPRGRALLRARLTTHSACTAWVSGWVPRTASIASTWRA